MQREDILKRIAEIDIELKRRRGNDRLANYNKGKKKHKKQMAFHKCKKRNRWVFGGNRSGKTECGAVECLWILRGIHPYRKNRKDVFGWAVSLSQQVQRDVAQAKILSYLPKSWIADITMLSGRKDSPSGGVIDQIKIKNVFGGISTLGFKSCDQGREKFQGSSLDFVWFDEEPPKDIYEECLMRVMDKQGDIFGTMTPLKGRTFIYNEIYLNVKNNPQIWHEFMTWEDNPYLSKKETKLLENSLASSSLDARKYGKFLSVEALLDAYKNLEAEFTRRSQRLKELEEGNKAQVAPSQGVAVSGDEFVKAALADEEVKNAVIGEYLKTVATGKSVPLIVGGISSAAPVCAPKTVKEAGALAERFLKN